MQIDIDNDRGVKIGTYRPGGVLVSTLRLFEAVCECGNQEAIAPAGAFWDQKAAIAAWLEGGSEWRKFRGRWTCPSCVADIEEAVQ